MRYLLKFKLHCHSLDCINYANINEKDHLLVKNLVCACNCQLVVLLHSYNFYDWLA